MLRACRRVLRPGGRLAFYVIALAPDISPELAEWVVETTPVFIESDLPYRELVAVAGFTDIEETDVTARYWETAQRWLHEAAALAPDLRQALGDDVFAEKQQNRRTSMEAIERGGLVRLRFTATA